MKRNLHLLVIDPQNDFCDLPAAYLPSPAPTAPALPVPGAHADMRKLADLIERGAAGLSGISVTCDAHHRLDIAHPTFWMDGECGAVAPFTEVAAADVRAGRFVPRPPGVLPRVLAYLDALEATGRHTLTVWPVHCEIGSWGQQVHADLRAACERWEGAGCGVVHTVSKGMNPWTEHYSAIQAEVPDADDESTQLNTGLVNLLAGADRLYIAGEAGSHCVKATTEHLLANLDRQSWPKIMLLTDCMSAVGGFEARQRSFIDAMARCGVQTGTAADALAELLANARP